MALTYDQMNAVCDDYLDKTIYQQVYEESAYLAILKDKNKITVRGGESYRFPIRWKKLGTSGKTGFREKKDFTSVDTRTSGDLDWAAVDGYTLMHWDEKVKNRGNSQIVDLLKDKTVELKEDFQDALASIIWGTATDSFSPLVQMIDSSDTYAGVAVSDVSQWASQEDSSTTQMKIYGSGSLTYMRNAATFGKHKPTHHFTTPDLYSKYESLLEPKERYYDKKMANLGFDSVTFFNRPVIADEYVPSGDWYGLNMDVIELVVQEGNDMNVTKWFTLEQAGFPNAMAKYMSMVCVHVCRERRSNFKFTALDYTL